MFDDVVLWEAAKDDDDGVLEKHRNLDGGLPRAARYEELFVRDAVYLEVRYRDTLDLS